MSARRTKASPRAVRTVTPPPADRSRWAIALALIAIVALVIRLFYLFQLRATPILAVVMGDGAEYDAWAREIAGGQWIGSRVFYQAPLYPYLLAIVFKAIGHRLFVVRLLQAVLGAASCALLGIAGRRFFGPREGLTAAMLLAVYPPAIFFDGLVQKSSLDLFLVVLILALLGEFLDRRRTAWLVGAGVAVGALMLNRENARVLYPVVVVWLLMSFSDVPFRRRAAWAAAFTAAIAVLLLPVGIRNYRVGGDFLLSTSQLGPNFYIGNHIGAGGTYEPLVPERGSVAYERDDATRLAEEATGRPLSAGDVSNYWLGRSFDDIHRQPIAWLKLMARKTLLTLNSAEIADTESLEAYAGYSPPLRALSWITFGLMLPIAAFGAWQTRRAWRRLALLYSMAAALALSVIMFFVLARYRYPMVPIVLLFSAAALASIRSTAADWRHSWPGLIAAAAAVSLAYAPIKTDYDNTQYNLGWYLIRAGRPADAIQPLEKAIAASPTYEPPHLNLGIALHQLGEKQRAIDELSIAVRLRPQDAVAQHELAISLRDEGNVKEALPAFEAAARLATDSAAAQADLANAFLETGDQDDAIRQYQKTLQLDPAYMNAHGNLGLLMRAKGNLTEALSQLREAVRLQPDSTLAHRNLADTLLSAGQLQEAIAQYESAVSLSPGFAETHYLLAQAYARAGRLGDALAHLRQARTNAKAAGQDDAVRQLDQALAAYEKRSGK